MRCPINGLHIVMVMDGVRALGKCKILLDLGAGCLAPLAGLRVGFAGRLLRCAIVGGETIGACEMLELMTEEAEWKDVPEVPGR